MLDALTRWLEIGDPLSTDDRAALARLRFKEREIRAGVDLHDEASCTLVLSGLFCSYNLLAEGRRQILALHIAGDVCDLQELALSSDIRLGALTTARVALISRGDLAAAADAQPGVARAIWRRTLADGLICRQWMTSLGVRDAYARTAHLFCELLNRYEAAGRSKDNGCELAVSQADFADALGLSVVHINRVLQRLRTEGLIEWRSKRLRVLDRERLESTAEFDPAYLKPKVRLPAPDDGFVNKRSDGVQSSIRIETGQNVQIDAGRSGGRPST